MKKKILALIMFMALTLSCFCSVEKVSAQTHSFGDMLIDVYIPCPQCHLTNSCHYRSVYLNKYNRVIWLYQGAHASRFIEYYYTTLNSMECICGYNTCRTVEHRTALLAFNEQGGGGGHSF